MAMFGLKEVLDPLATEVREFGDSVLDVLVEISKHLAVVQTAARKQIELTEETNRLLAVLVEANGSEHRHIAELVITAATSPKKPSRGQTVGS